MSLPTRLMKICVCILINGFSAQVFANGHNVKLFFEDALPFDGACMALKQHDDYKITTSMRDELTLRLPEFTKTWEKGGSALIREMAKLLKHPYGRNEETMAFTLCQWFSPMSNPLIFRVREYLKTTGIDNPKGPTEIKPESYFMGQIFHELIHRYLDKHFLNIDQPQNSVLIKSHSEEPPGVLSHLHHLSIQKAVYLKLNRKGELDKIVELDSQIRGGTYKRAWEIIGSDGYEKYIDELLKYRSQK